MNPNGTSQPTVTWVLRGARPGQRSIERLFSALEPFVRAETDLKIITLPFASAKPWQLWKNMTYVRAEARGIVHVLGDVHYAALRVPKLPTVITIHDCGRLFQLRALRKWFFRKIWFDWPLKRAAAITVISRATRENLMKFCQPQAPLTLIENCVPALPAVEPAERSGGRARILQIGSGPHKNLDALIAAAEGQNWTLVIVGNPTIAQRNRLVSLRIEHEILTNISDAELAATYQSVDVLFFASLHEGFGLPIIEAQSLRVPVVTSNLMDMPYVAGAGGALCVAPRSPTEIRAAINQILQHPELKLSLVASGLTNACRFSPAAVASQYVALYRSLWLQD